MIEGQPERTRDELIAEVQRKHARWEALVSRAADRLEEPFAGTWSLRDVSAHLCAYERFVCASMGGSVRPLPEPPDDTGNDVQKRNAFLHEADRDRPTAEVMAEAAAVRREIVAMLRSKSEDELRTPRFMPWHEWPMWRWVVHLSVEHYDEHLPGLEEWLAHR